MDVIYGLIPGMILLGLLAVGVFFWAAKSGQFDDMEGEAHRILMDDDLDEEAHGPDSQHTTSSEKASQSGSGQEPVRGARSGEPSAGESRRG